MGVPVVGKNYFPSNIQGLPTWYEIRVTGDGYHSRSNRVDVMVAMNAQTYARDMADVVAGGWLIYDSTWPRSSLLDRDDITVIGIPLSRMCNEHFDGVRARILMKNIAYVGAIAALLDIDRDIITALLEETYAAKKKLIASNVEAIKLGYDYMVEHYPCPLPMRVEKMNATDGHIVIDGNTAAGLGCVYAGATIGAWYPITPSTSLMDAFREYCSKYRIDPESGKRSYIIIQAEDELAAIGMVLGANWMGARSFTPTTLFLMCNGSAHRLACQPAHSSATSLAARTHRTATRCTFCCFQRTRRNVSIWRRWRSICQSACRRRSWCCPIWISA
jgi:2-oxoglutarate ferredoxin oxidoreductase subunit alpha